nr:hypothetical protein [Burkholderia sp. IMCC1007]
MALFDGGPRRVLLSLGEIRDRSFEARRYRASDLNLITAAIVEYGLR